MTDLIEPVKPDVLAPEPHPVIAGNHADDDGSAIDEWFEEPSHAPQKYDDVPVKSAPEVKPVATRIISRTVALNNASDPLMVLGADTSRKDLIIRIGADRGSDDVRVMIGSDKTDLYNVAYLNSIATLVTGNTDIGSEWRSDKHTGAVWVSAVNAPGSVDPFVVNVSVWAVTE